MTDEEHLHDALVKQQIASLLEILGHVEHERRVLVRWTAYSMPAVSLCLWAAWNLHNAHPTWLAACLGALNLCAGGKLAFHLWVDWAGWRAIRKQYRAQLAGWVRQANWPSTRPPTPG